jgi:arylsulfatase A-like enzyme
MTSRRTLTLLTAVIAAAGVGLWGAAYYGESAASVIIVTLDTTRADRLSPYGLMDVSMPALERLAGEGIVFDQATSVAPLTLPAHASLFTGLLPPAHGVRDNADRPLTSEKTTMAEILRGNGFSTAAIVGSDVLHPDRGLAQGFEVYRTAAAVDGFPAHPRQRRGDDVMKEALQWLEGVGRSRFFLWVHLYDAHRPYDPPEPFRSRYADPYIGEIAFADAQIGRLLEALDAHRLRDRTIVVVAGDHGESLGEHGERDHGIFVYESVLRVPLIVRAPAVRPARIGTVVRLTDVFPTVLDLLGLPLPAVDGQSLLKVMNGSERAEDLEAYAESLYPQRFGWSPLRAIREGRFKLIDAPRRELYDLERDPFEERNLYDERRALGDAMAQRVAMLAGGTASSLANRRPAASAEVQQRLSALGYVGSGPSQPGAAHQPLPDPKDCIAFAAPDASRAVPLSEHAACGRRPMPMDSGDR